MNLFDNLQKRFTQLKIRCESTQVTDRSSVESYLSQLETVLEMMLDTDVVATRPFLERALPIWERLRGDNHRETGELLINLGYCHKQSSQLDQALYS
ncbi:MAG: tetratricopeptide repeat protein [Anaerolineae bacterium]